ncbi:phosphotransferase [Streptomyces sediminimaris]|uniref:phosphotransferase n=1 Tax=Streptomyces sediminimaris TaxID=3383721 RepID=UPI00399AA98C
MAGTQRMTTHSAPDSRPRPDQVSVDASLVMPRPLEGYHHVTHVWSLADRSRTWIKIREPRDRILWFDRRCFQSEEDLLRALKKLDVACVPEVVEVGDTGFQGFIEGRTVGTWRWWASRRVPDAVFDQLVELFRETARIKPDMLTAERRCTADDRPKDGDSGGFLERLIFFMRSQVYEANKLAFGELFRKLGVTDESFSRLEEHVSGLTGRPFCLLHADLHRKNLIVDPNGRLWVIDWELAMVGDPLYDLATHLYLMRYPKTQADRMAQEWCRVVERVSPGSSFGWEQDLPRYLAFKRAQSVFTDVIRESLKLRERNRFNWPALPGTTRKLHRILAAAAEPLGLATVATQAQIMSALIQWHRTTPTHLRKTPDPS